VLLGRAVGKGRKVFFFEKKNQKTFCTWLRVAGDRLLNARTKSQEFFVSFFQKRNSSLTCFFLCVPPALIVRAGQ
jgi:hypothetical protein